MLEAPAIDDQHGATRGLRVGSDAMPHDSVAGVDAELLRAVGGEREFASGLVGRRLGPYRLGERIGAGGMGVVYKAEHVWLARSAAIKFLVVDGSGDDELARRFTHEARAIGALDHPNIVRAVDAGAIGNAYFLATEFIEGNDLAKVTRACGPIPVQAACEIVRQAALGLAHAHERGLVHRDVKPSNLIVSTAGAVKLLDFGLARQTAGQATLTGAGQIIGTLDFLAPEQANDARHVDHRADIYSLGCTFYFLLSGSVPFGGLDYSTPACKIKGHLADAPRDVGELRSDVPGSVRNVLERMMAKNPAQRYQSASDVAAALSKAAAGAELGQLFGERNGVATRPAQRSLLESFVRGAGMAVRKLGWRRQPTGAFAPSGHRAGMRFFSFSGVVMLTVAIYFAAGVIRPRWQPYPRLPRTPAIRQPDPALPGSATFDISVLPEPHPARPVPAQEKQSSTWGDWFKGPVGGSGPKKVENPFVEHP